MYFEMLEILSRKLRDRLIDGLMSLMFPCLQITVIVSV